MFKSSAAALAFILLGLSSLALSAETIGHVVTMPPPYSSESREISFCYAFAAATLIDQMLFESNHSSSKYEPVSMLDLAVNGMGMTEADISHGREMKTRPTFDDLGNKYRVLIYAKLKQQLAKESCAPFQRLKILRSSNPSRDADFKALANPIAAYNKKRKQNLPVDESVVADQILAWDPNLNIAKSQIQTSLKNNPMASYNDFLSFLASIVVPDNCHNSGVSLPNFEVAMVKVDSNNRFQIPAYLISTLNRDRPLIWEFCLNDTCTTRHVLVIFGWRNACDQDKKICQFQFLLRDSGREITDHPGDTWVNESFISRKLDLMFKNYESLAAKNIIPILILNLEY